MHPTSAIESNDSPAPGIIPEPAHVQDQPAAASSHAEPPVRGSAVKPPSSPSQRNPARMLLDRVLGVFRGDKYMVDAYPPAWDADAAQRGGER
jgi:hypothetical protein